MNDLNPPERLLVSAKHGGALERGLTTARSRSPSDEQLRALEMTLAASLGGVALPTVTGAAATGANGAPTVSGTSGVGSAMHAVLSAGTLKLTLLVTVAITAAAAGGLVVRRYAVKAATRPDVATAVRGTSNRAGSPEVAAVPASPTSPIPALHEAAPPPTSTRAVATRRAERSRPARAASRARPVEAASNDDLETIKRAQQALTHDPARALALVEAQHREFPGTAFAQEDEVIAVEALSKLGRAAEARERAARFVGRYPASVHTPHMRRAAALVP